MPILAKEPILIPIHLQLINNLWAIGLRRKYEYECRGDSFMPIAGHPPWD